ncbi:MAG: mRNA binding protein puf3 [Watsoniomyces obsoletus]|nr:MAG: mRNA binding protein puf3 [Watsoniomyces obsoletus]
MATSVVQPGPPQVNGTKSKQKMSKNQMRRAKKKEDRAKLQASRETSVMTESEAESTEVGTHHEQVWYANSSPVIKAKPVQDPQPQAISLDVDADPDDTNVTDELAEDDPLYADFKNIFDRFKPQDARDAEVKDKGEVYYDDDAEIPDEDEEEAQKVEKGLSKKARKAQNKLSVAELKALVPKPEIVDWTDTSASDPRLLVHIKSYRNVVPVPSHWSLKREYLSSKRGIEKAPFSLPKFIQETGIAEMRDAVLEKQDQASLKQKQRERVQPKMGKLDIDYQKLYEAFFRFQTKPELTRYGEVYYEGKELETNLRHLRPGELSDELKEALNIPPGAPPPWLLNQQRFGPPPSYPALKIPGLNAPIPPGAEWGFKPGAYGKPPVDEVGRPLWGGDVYGVVQLQTNAQTGEPIEKTPWGELQAPEEESEEEEEEESDEEEEDGDGEDVGAGLKTPSGLETPSGMASTVPSEFGADAGPRGDFDLRKQRRGTETEESVHPRSAYTVVPETQGRVQGFFGSERAYDVAAAQRNQHLPVLDQEESSRKRKKPGDVDVAIDPDSLQAQDGISKEELRRKFEEKKNEERGDWGFQEDLSDMIASESRKRLKRDEERRSKR